MKVIVASFSKCGTKTLHAALEELGFNVWDFSEAHTYHYEQWTKIMNYGANVEDFRKMFQNIDAVCDMPTFFFWEEIHRAFPDAKIILTERDEDDWWISFEKQLRPKLYQSRITRKLVALMSPTLKKLNCFYKKMFRVIFGTDVLGDRQNQIGYNKTLIKMAYRRHNAYVKQSAPKDKLLVADFREGWDPICKFLGKPTPNSPFPHANKKGIDVDNFVKSEVYGLVRREVVRSAVLIISSLCFFASLFFV